MSEELKAQLREYLETNLFISAQAKSSSLIISLRLRGDDEPFTWTAVQLSSVANPPT